MGQVVRFVQEGQEQIDQVEGVDLLQVVQRMAGVVVEEPVGQMCGWVLKGSAGLVS